MVMDPIFVAEFTTNHMGNLNLLLKMVDAAADAGASYIKMQKKDIESFYTQEKLNGSYLSPYGSTYREYRTTFEFDFRDHVKFDNRCRDRGIKWFATAQDAVSLDFLKQFDLPIYKIASCNAKDLDFVDYVKREIGDKPMVVSTGGTDLRDIDAIVELIDDRPLYILQCTSTYPCSLDELHLGNIPKLKERYASQSNVKIGYSGHELGIKPSIIAAHLGAEMIERHFCMSRHSFVHHIECSIEPHEYKEMVEAVKLGLAPPRHPHALNLEDYEKCVQSNFGMTDSQKRFLVDGKYGKDFLGEKSKI